MRKLTFILFTLSFISCNQGTEKTVDTPSANVDSLTAAFLAGWNNKDSVAIMNTIADNAIVMNDSLIHSGHKAIADQWISGGIKVLSNIKIVAIIKNSDQLLAYSGGTYTLDLTPPGGPTLKEKGNYSLVWTKQQGGEWRLTLIHIEDITRMPDIK